MTNAKGVKSLLSLAESNMPVFNKETDSKDTKYRKDSVKNIVYTVNIQVKGEKNANGKKLMANIKSLA